MRIFNTPANNIPASVVMIPTTSSNSIRENAWRHDMTDTIYVEKRSFDVFRRTIAPSLRTTDYTLSVSTNPLRYSRVSMALALSLLPVNRSVSELNSSFGPNRHSVLRSTLLLFK